MNDNEKQIESKVAVEKKSITISEFEDGRWDLTSNGVPADMMAKLLVNFAVDAIIQQTTTMSIKTIMQTLRAEFGNQKGAGIISPHTGTPVIK